MEGVSDRTLIDIADDIGDDTRFKRLADNLMISAVNAQRFKKTNMMFGEFSSEGTLQMLHTWRDGTRTKYQRPKLMEALVDAGFDKIAEKYFDEEELPEAKRARKRKHGQNTGEGSGAKLAKPKVQKTRTKHEGEGSGAKLAKQKVPKTRTKHEDESDQVDEVIPDDEGSYQKYHVKAAKPTKGQLNKSKNYFMASAEKGIVFILNNFCENRKGSDIDTKNIRHVFEQIGYESVVKKDLKSAQLRTALDKLILNEIKEEHTSVVLVLMSHGNKAGIKGTDGKIVSLEEIKEKLSAKNCPALKDKPKIIFVQACRGKKVTPSVTDGEPLASVESSSEHTNLVTSKVEQSTENPCADNEPGPSQSIKMKEETVHMVETDGRTPENADMYIANSTPEGYYSYRVETYGSWFIQGVCEELIAKAHEQDLDSIMNAVSNRVMTKLGKTTSEQLSHQTPEISKQGIRKKIFFLPKYPDV